MDDVYEMLHVLNQVPAFLGFEALKNVLSRDLNVPTDHTVVICKSRLFQRIGPVCFYV